jgi:enoyl-[acyl-carrier-protein] reductase (NADH)
LWPTGFSLPPIGARASARHVADAAIFLMSKRVSHITGSCLDVSGGTSLRLTDVRK